MLKSKGDISDKGIVRVVLEALESRLRPKGLVGTDPIAYMNTKVASLYSAALVSELRYKEGEWFSTAQLYALIRTVHEVGGTDGPGALQGFM